MPLAYFDLAHLSLPLFLFLFLFFSNDTTLLFFYFDCRCTFGSLLEDEGDSLADIWLIAAGEGFLVEKGTAVDSQMCVPVIETVRRKQAYSSSPLTRPMKPKPFSAFHRYIVTYFRENWVRAA